MDSGAERGSIWAMAPRGTAAPFNAETAGGEAPPVAVLPVGPDGPVLALEAAPFAVITELLDDVEEFETVAAAAERT